MLRLYDDPRSRNGYKVRLLLSHLGLPFRTVAVDILSGATRQADFLAKNIVGRIPVLELDDGTCLAESGAILVYLAEDTAFLPADRRMRAEVLRWMFFEQNMLEGSIGTARFWRKLGRDKERPDAFAHRLAVADDALQALDPHLAGRDWLAAGRFTIADIAGYGYVSVGEDAGIDLTAFPAVTAWLARIAALPAHVASDWGFPLGRTLT